MNLLLASLRRVEIRIEPQTITDFLKWKNRMQQYNGGACRQALSRPRKSPTISWKQSELTDLEPSRHRSTLDMLAEA